MSLSFEDFVDVRETHNNWHGSFVVLAYRDEPTDAPEELVVLDHCYTPEDMCYRRDIGQFIHKAFEWGYRAAMRENRNLLEKERKENQAL